MDARLRKRYQTLVAHGCQTARLASSMKIPFDHRQTHSHTQALWRFLANPRVQVQHLAQPLLQNALQGARDHCHDTALIMHDWSMIALAHDNKPDRLQRTHPHDIGYELQSSLLVSDHTALPIAPVAQNLVTAHTRLSSYDNLHPASHLDELGQRMAWLAAQPWDKPLLHIIDREADSAAHLRHWSQAGHHYLIRVNGTNRLHHQGQTQRTASIAATLDYRPYKTLIYRGKKAHLSLAETDILLTRPARPKGKDANGKRLPPQAGEPLALRLICSKLEASDGKPLAQWHLLGNSAHSAEKLVDYYHARWQIESYFKLLKSAGHQMESWLQQSGEAFFKRLLIVAQSCVMIWRLMNDQRAQSQALKALLIRISGRNTKKKQPFTAPALLAGYLSLLSAHELLQEMSPEEIAGYVRGFQQGFV